MSRPACKSSCRSKKIKARFGSPLRCMSIWLLTKAAPARRRGIKRQQLNGRFCIYRLFFCRYAFQLIIAALFLTQLFFCYIFGLCRKKGWVAPLPSKAWHDDCIAENRFAILWSRLPANLSDLYINVSSRFEHQAQTGNLRILENQKKSF